MFEKMWNNLRMFEEHHQVVFALLVACAIILLSWGIENILEHYVFHKKPLWGYVSAIALGLALLWITKHILLRVM